MCGHVQANPNDCFTLATAGAVNTSDYEEYGYDAAGNRTSLRKRDGSVLTYTYDALNRMIVKTVPERTSGAHALTAAQTRDVHYSYDVRNLQLSARFDSQAGEGIANAYDGFGRLVSSSNSMGGVTRTLTYQYDAAGNRTRITHPDGFSSATTYDALGRPNHFDANGAGQIYAYYLPHGGFQGVGRANGTASGYAYDGLQRLQARLDYFAGTGNNVYRQWSYNAAGGLSSQHRDNDAYAWTRHSASVAMPPFDYIEWPQKKPEIEGGFVD